MAYLEEILKEARDNKIDVENLDKVVEAIKKLQAENEKLRKCVERYANKESWIYRLGSGYTEIMIQDWYTDRERLENDPCDYRWLGGKLARQTLRKIDNQEGD